MPIHESDDDLISDRKFRRMIGDPSAMTIYRDEKRDPNFPRSYVRNNRKFRRRGDVKAYIAALPRTAKAPKAALRARQIEIAIA
jgi:hypothetical protein